MRSAFKLPTRNIRAVVVLIMLWAIEISAQNPTTAQATKRNMELLLCGHGSSLIDKQIVLYGVTSQGKPGLKNASPKDQGPRYTPAFWVGRNKQQRILVVIPNGLLPVGPSNLTRSVETGDIVDITGTVRTAPGTTQLKAVYRLDDEGVAMVQHAGVIVEAGSIVVYGPAKK